MTDYMPIHNDHPVWFNGVKVNNLDFVTTGVGVLITGIAGWQDGVEVRDVREPRPGFDGEDADSSFMGGRTITVSGRVAAATWAALQTAKQALAVTFAPTAAEVLFKVPTATASAPTTTYATESMTNYERSTCKVVEGIAFGEQAGFTQAWQVVLRTSDARIYSDTITTDDGTIASYAGTVATPLKIEAPLDTATDGQGDLSSATKLIARTSVDTYPMLIGSAGFTTVPSMVVDGGTRDAYLKLPHAVARKEVYDALWYYRLNESAGTTADNYEGTAGYDGTIAGTPSLNQSGPCTDMTSILFDGVDDRISRTYVSAMHPAADFTLEAWIKPTTVSAGQHTVVIANDGAAAGFIMYRTAADLFCRLGNGGATGVVVGRYTIAAGSWYHVAVTYSSGSAAMYVNGNLVGRATVSFVRATSGTLYIGDYGSGFQYFDGNISGVGMYSTAFPAAIIEDMYSDAAAAAETRYKAGGYIVDRGAWPTLSGALTLSGYNAVTNTPANMVTTYRTARL